MLVGSEFVSRALKKRAQSDPSFAGDERAVGQMSRDAMRSPDAFVTDDEDQAFVWLSDAINAAKREIESYEDAEFYGEVTLDAALPRTRALLKRCCDRDPHCYDARMLMVLAAATTDDDAIEQLMGLEEEARAWCGERSRLLDGSVADAWDAVFLRPYLRIEAKIVDLLVGTARYRLALDRCERLLRDSPADGQGIRHTACLLCARLEDERGLDALDAAFDHRGSAWTHLSRAVLLYKLGRVDAARRATTGMARLCPGAAYYLVQPEYVEPYVPDRPLFTPGTAMESMLATYEADFLINDTPDFVNWAMSIHSFAKAAQDFGRAHGGDMWDSDHT